MIKTKNRDKQRHTVEEAEYFATLYSNETSLFIGFKQLENKENNLLKILGVVPIVTNNKEKKIGIMNSKCSDVELWPASSGFSHLLFDIFSSYNFRAFSTLPLAPNSQIPSSPRRCTNLSLARGFVNKSAS